MSAHPGQPLKVAEGFKSHPKAFFILVPVVFNMCNTCVMRAMVVIQCKITLRYLLETVQNATMLLRKEIV